MHISYRGRKKVIYSNIFAQDSSPTLSPCGIERNMRTFLRVPKMPSISCLSWIDSRSDSGTNQGSESLVFTVWNIVMLERSGDVKGKGGTELVGRSKGTMLFQLFMPARERTAGITETCKDIWIFLVQTLLLPRTKPKATTQPTSWVLCLHRFSSNIVLAHLIFFLTQSKMEINFDLWISLLSQWLSLGFCSSIYIPPFSR